MLRTEGLGPPTQPWAPARLLATLMAAPIPPTVLTRYRTTPSAAPTRRLEDSHLTTTPPATATRPWVLQPGSTLTALATSVLGQESSVRMVSTTAPISATSTR